jgi:hypothetical protein
MQLVSSEVPSMYFIIHHQIMDSVHFVLRHVHLFATNSLTSSDTRNSIDTWRMDGVGLVDFFYLIGHTFKRLQIVCQPSVSKKPVKPGLAVYFIWRITFVNLPLVYLYCIGLVSAYHTRHLHSVFIRRYFHFTDCNDAQQRQRKLSNHGMKFVEFIAYYSNGMKWRWFDRDPL